jgi:hypothetical protein
MANLNNNPGITDDDIKKTKEYTDASRNGKLGKIKLINT